MSRIHHFDLFPSIRAKLNDDDDYDESEQEIKATKRTKIQQVIDPLCENKTINKLDNKIDPKIINFNLQTHNLCSDSKAL